MRDMAEKFNIEVKTTAAYSPWNNGLLERHNQTLTDILLKVKKDNQCDWKIDLDWDLQPLPASVWAEPKSAFNPYR